VTIDAMGCQRGIAQKIGDKKADYVLALKGNQGSLREDVEIFAAEQKANGFKETKISQDQTVDGDHGRIETRTYTVFHDVAWLQERHDWPGLKAVVMVESTRELADKIERETRFYITSLAWTAHLLGPVVRAHWSIENSLHWVMDMSSSHRRLVNPSSQDGRAAASTVVVISLWICGRRAHTAWKGLPAARRPQLHRLNNNNNKAVYQ